jgi:hypothetical protein
VRRVRANRLLYSARPGMRHFLGSWIMF